MPSSSPPAVTRVALAADAGAVAALVATVHVGLNAVSLVMGLCPNCRCKRGFAGSTAAQEERRNGRLRALPWTRNPETALVVPQHPVHAIHYLLSSPGVDSNGDGAVVIHVEARMLRGSTIARRPRYLAEERNKGYGGQVEDKKTIATCAVRGRQSPAVWDPGMACVRDECVQGIH